MKYELPTTGSIDEELTRNATDWWLTAALDKNPKLSRFDNSMSLEKRIAWALKKGFDIATIYSRYSTKLQNSTADQVRECIIWAAKNGMYVPPELICIDEGVKGSKVRRTGLERMKNILKVRLATVLLVFKVSRLFRQAFKGYQLVQEEVIEEGLRAVSVSQGIDTIDVKSWKIQMQVHGLCDDILLDAIGDHVRSGLRGIFEKGWTVGPLGVGYRRKILPDAPLTKTGKPRTVPEVDPEAAALIRQHARWLLEGMSYREGLRRWIAAGGPCDPRSTIGRMSPTAYRRLWKNRRITGRWEFFRMRNQFSTKRDSVCQIEQPDDEVSVSLCEELRILDDESFHALQKLSDEKKSGPRGPRKTKETQLWDLTTGLFFCVSCSTPESPVRLYQTGAQGRGMQCKNGDQCARKSAVRRKDAVCAVCETLTELIQRDAALVEEIICKAVELDDNMEDHFEEEIASLEKKKRILSARINDLHELLGTGTDDDRRDYKSRIRAVQSERSSLEIDLAQLKKEQAGIVSKLTPEEVREILREFTQLLGDAVSEKLGEDSVYKALSVFRHLTGGKIMVHVEQRPARKQTNVRGVFLPQLVAAVNGVSKRDAVDSSLVEEVSVWLRKPPRQDFIAERVHQMIDIEKKSHRETAKILQGEGHNVNSGNVWYAHQRWYEMKGLPTPKTPYNNGTPRKHRKK